MKEKVNIIMKLIRKQAILLLTLTAIMVLFFVVVNRPKVYASEQVATVKCDVSVVDGEKQELIASNTQAISNLESTMINFDDINVSLNKNSKLEFKYTIENVTNAECVYNLSLKKDRIENFKIEYYIGNDFNGDLETLNYVLAPLSIVEVKVVAYVDSVYCDACLSGSIELTFECVGEI